MTQIEYTRLHCVMDGHGADLRGTDLRKSACLLICEDQREKHSENRNDISTIQAHPIEQRDDIENPYIYECLTNR